MYTTLNRIFLLDLYNITAADEVVAIFTSDLTPSFEKKIIKLMATGAAINDQYYLNPQLDVVGLNKAKFIDYVNLINTDLREIYHNNTTNWPFSQEEKFIVDYFYDEALKPHISGFILSSQIESSIFLSSVSSDEPLLRAFPQANDLLKLMTAKFLYLLELNPNIYTIINLGNFSYNQLTASLIAISLIGGELFHNVDFYNMTSDSFDIIQSYITFKDCVFNNINTLFNVMSTDGLNSFLSLEFDKAPSVWESIPNHLYTNRLVLKKIPFLGDLLFQIVDYCCRGNNYINIAPFVEKTVDLTIRYSLEIGHFFHLFSSIHYTTPTIDNLPESSNGDGGDGSDKNPSFNRKVKVIGGFALGFALVVGIAKLFGNT